MRNRPQRKNPRLSGYDYSQNGAYFVTICTHERQQFFGYIADGEMHLSPIGQIVDSHWQDLPHHFPHVNAEVYVIMPNHLHGMVLIEDDHRSKSATLGTLIGTFKAAVTRHVHRDISDPPVPLWQTRYHDHIIRSATTYETIYHYVLTNPERWTDDKFFVDDDS
jgi:putative transposase